jgi:hypothetical protein
MEFTINFYADVNYYKLQLKLLLSINTLLTLTYQKS